MARHPAPEVVALAGLSHAGLDPAKQVNEDCSAALATSAGLLLLVCDGMGGHQAGRAASRRAVEEVTAWLAKSTEPPAMALSSAIAAAGRAVFSLGGAPGAAGRPGTTCVAGLVARGTLTLAHVGDSRAYLFRAGRLHRLTRDHSVVQALVDRGEMTAEEARVHPDAHQITRALGMLESVEVELSPPLPLASDDTLLFCSDGLTDMLPDESIAAVLGEQLPRGVDAAVERLVALANQAGGHDNITVLVARLGQTGTATPPGGSGTRGGDAVRDEAPDTLVDRPPFTVRHDGWPMPHVERMAPTHAASGDPGDAPNRIGPPATTPTLVEQPASNATPPAGQTLPAFAPVQPAATGVPAPTRPPPHATVDPPPPARRPSNAARWSFLGSVALVALALLLVAIWWAVDTFGR